MTAKVLVVDDIPSNIKLLEAKLNAEYYTVITASNGEQAIELVNDQQPDIILLDVMMPKMNGFELCKKIKSNLLTMHIPIVMVTALHDTRDKVHGINAGADDFLTKPISETELFMRIKSLMRFKMLIDELRLRGRTNADVDNEIIYHNIMHYIDDIANSSILIVDEDIYQSEYICNVLKPRFNKVNVLNDPSKIHSVSDQSNYDIIISDTSFNVIDSLRLCSEFRSNAETRHTPILVLCDCSSNIDYLVKAFDIGINDYLLVPVDESELIARVTLQIKRKRFQDALRMKLFDNAKMSIKDPLTNCYNRRYFDAYLKNVVEESLTKNKDLSLMMLDIDFFKQVNDNFGHGIGDELLKQVQSRIVENIRVTNLVARLGGEEFAVVLPGTNISHAYIAAERIRNIIEKPFTISNYTLIKTVSIGIASVHICDLNNVNLLVERADKCLYIAKSTGRNKVVTDNT